MYVHAHYLNNIKMGFKNLFIVTVLVISTTGSQTHENRAMMNPKHPIDMQIPVLNSLPYRAVPVLNSNLKAELRGPSLATSEVMELLAEDEMRQQSNSSSKNPGPVASDSARMDCSKITMQIFQVLLQNPDTVEPEDYSCGLLNLISNFEKSTGRMRSLEASLHSATNTIKTLESLLQTEISKTQFHMKELNETVHKESERAIKAENVIARRVLSEKARVDTIQKNLTDLLVSSTEQIKELEITFKQLEPVSSSRPLPAEKEATTPYHPAAVLLPPVQPQSSVIEEDIQQINVKLTSLQQFIQDLSHRITQMENGSEEHANKGIAHIFKTYASLANEIETETVRATGVETSLKTLITNEIAGLGKQILTLQERVTDEKNRVQIIENRRTADLFEEINRAKSEENRLEKKLKDEMSKAASAFKRLEMHVDTQTNSSKPLNDEFKNATRRINEVEDKCLEQISMERIRALSIETTLKTQLDAEIQRAMTVENELRVMNNDEKDRALTAEQDLKAAIEIETYRSKGVEYSISGQITAEMERSKQSEQQIHEHINANMTRLLTDIIKEFTRAQNAEMELTEKIREESYRAIKAEEDLQANVNAEQIRVTNKEKELFFLIKTQEKDINSTFDQCRGLIELESVRARGAETNLENHILEESTRSKNNEEKIINHINVELAKSKSIEVNITQTSIEVLRATKELELEVRKTVMAEVARAVDAENALKQHLFAEIERARGAELVLAQGKGGNYTEVSIKMQEMMREIEKDNLRLEDISLQISRNLTGDILTLAELFDDKLDDLERNENIRLKRVEDDMKKCCSGSSWRWRSQKGKSNGSAAGAVINKIMQVLGGGNDEDNQDIMTPSAPSTPSKKNSGNGSKPSTRNKGGSSKGRSMDDNQENNYDDNPTSEDSKVVNFAAVPVGIPINQSQRKLSDYQSKRTDDVASKANNQTVVYVLSNKVVENEQGEVVELPKKVPRKRLLRDSRRVNGLSNTSSNDSLISVHSVNSKVTSTFG